MKNKNGNLIKKVLPLTMVSSIIAMTSSLVWLYTDDDAVLWVEILYAIIYVVCAMWAVVCWTLHTNQVADLETTIEDLRCRIEQLEEESKHEVACLK